MGIALLFGCSGVLLALLLFLRSYEEAQGMRMLPQTRRALDIATLNTVRASIAFYGTVMQSLSRDVLLRGLHVVTVLLLHLVHLFEQWLLALITRVRRKRHAITVRSLHRARSLRSAREKEHAGDAELHEGEEGHRRDV